ncbi:hypothetical protein [Virgibacillus salexigens]|uniref:Uncharacterized protein n=1 Tax=Virgibacillus kapii TaxID=1638645 RepID=A0ABQ2DBC3_9BACI|nr:hypothetical protein [Virgibacillus kapii]GGJ51247.1 hypothetical protein GCM10007111_11810 [Virgibacillus kapii]
MIQHINSFHLSFVNEAKEVFESDIKIKTYRNDDDSLIALRYGAEEDCILVYELGECIANFTQQIESKVGFLNES